MQKSRERRSVAFRTLILMSGEHYGTGIIWDRVNDRSHVDHHVCVCGTAYTRSIRDALLMRNGRKVSPGIARGGKQI